MYSATVEEALVMGEVTVGQFALLDRLQESLQLSKSDAERLELDLDLVRSQDQEHNPEKELR